MRSIICMTRPVVLIVQARMSSERLPGKVMKPVLGKPLLAYLIGQLRRVTLADQLVIATSLNADESPIVDLCRKMDVACYRGDLNDVLGRYAAAAEAYRAQTIVRICADCPLIDPAIVDQVIEAYLAQSPTIDYMSNCQRRTFPRGQDVEVFSRQALEIAASEAKRPAEREHVTPYLYHHPERFRIGSVVDTVDRSSERWVVDTQEDFQLTSQILTELQADQLPYGLNEVLAVLERHPDWRLINAHVQQKGLSS